MRKRVLIIENELLLGAGLQNVLNSEPNLAVAGISANNEAEIIQEIWRFQPDVVILDKATTLTNATKLLAHLNCYPNLRLVVVSANDNLVQIYDKQQTLITKVSDLIVMIHP